MNLPRLYKSVITGDEYGRIEHEETSFAKAFSIFLFACGVVIFLCYLIIA